MGEFSRTLADVIVQYCQSDEAKHTTNDARQACIGWMIQTALAVYKMEPRQ